MYGGGHAATTWCIFWSLYDRLFCYFDRTVPPSSEPGLSHRVQAASRKTKTKHGAAVNTVVLSDIIELYYDNVHLKNKYGDHQNRTALYINIFYLNNSSTTVLPHGCVLLVPAKLYFAPGRYMEALTRHSYLTRLSVQAYYYHAGSFASRNESIKMIVVRITCQRALVHLPKKEKKKTKTTPGVSTSSEMPRKQNINKVVPQ